MRGNFADKLRIRTEPASPPRAGPCARAPLSPPAAPASFFPAIVSVPRDESRLCGCCGYVPASPVTSVAVEYGCVQLFASLPSPALARAPPGRQGFIRRPRRLCWS
jgi:hypothetical protein